MHVSVPDRLPRSAAHVDPDVESVWAEIARQPGLHVANQPPNIGQLILVEVEEVRDVPARNDQRMAGVQGESVKEGNRTRG